MKFLIKNIINFFHSLLTNSKKINRDVFLKLLQRNTKILEIGPFTNPSLRGANVYYFDVLNRSDLMKRAKIENYPIFDIPEINFVSSDGDLSIIKEEFDNVYSSHCIEHQPDLIKHLVDVNKILKSGGKYYIVIPDKRYCFDALLPETNIAGVLEAFYEKRTRHSLENVIQHGALTTHHSPYKHWLGNHGTHEDIQTKINSVLKLYEHVNGAYLDVHSWRFTPNSFVEIITILYNMNLINLTVSKVFQTAFTSNEFYIILEKNN